MSALATQNLLKTNKVDIFRNDEWQGASTDPNACEHLGAIIKDRVDQRLPRHRKKSLIALTNALKKMEFDHDLFVSTGITAHVFSNSVSGHTKYCSKAL